MDDTGQVKRIVLMAHRYGLRLVTFVRPAGYVLVNRSNVVEFGASPGPHRPTLDEIELYLIKRPSTVVSERSVALRKRPRWMKGGSWP